MLFSRWSAAAASAAVLLLSSGCFKSYVVVSFRAPEEAASEATATASQALASASLPARTVVVRAPAGCRPDAGATVSGSGVALRSRSVLESRCETWLSELEKALATRFTVVGWRELARAERAGRAAAAREAGADLVLVVTELQAEPLLVSSSDPAAVRLVAAMPTGEPAAEGVISPKAERTIRRIVAARYPDGAVAGVRVAIEIAAVPVAGGEPVWTYRGRVTDALSGALESRMLLRGRASSWRPVVPRGWRPAAAPASSAGDAEDPVRARLREIAAAVAADVVASFPTAG